MGGVGGGGGEGGLGVGGDTCRHILRNLWHMWPRPFLKSCRGTDGGQLVVGCPLMKGRHLKSSTGAENSAGRVLSSSVLCLSHRGANACRPCGGGGSAVCHFGSRFLCGDRTRLGKLAAPVASFPTEVDSSELWVLQVKKSAVKAVHRSLRGSQGSRGSQ